MSEQAESASREDKFFGLRHTEDTDLDGSDDSVQIEVVEDEDQKDAKPLADLDKVEQLNAIGDDELGDYSEDVKKRINRLTFQKNEERRQREQVIRERDEAVRWAQEVNNKYHQMEQYVRHGEGQYAETAKHAAEAALKAAESDWITANDRGDSEAMLEATKAINLAQQQMANATAFENDYTSRLQAHQRQQEFQQRQPQPQPQQQRPKVPEPTNRDKAWAEQNPWFQDESHRDMTALAYGVHEQLVKEQIAAPGTDEYYAAIDKTMRARFPEYFGHGSEGSGRQPASSHGQPSSVVAPSQRASGVKQRKKVKLTTAQIAAAKRMGITPEQYAAGIPKE